MSHPRKVALICHACKHYRNAHAHWDDTGDQWLGSCMREGCSCHAFQNGNIWEFANIMTSASGVVTDPIGPWEELVCEACWPEEVAQIQAAGLNPPLKGPQPVDDSCHYCGGSGCPACDASKQSREDHQRAIIALADEKRTAIQALNECIALRDDLSERCNHYGAALRDLINNVKGYQAFGVLTSATLFCIANAERALYNVDKEPA